MIITFVGALAIGLISAIGFYIYDLQNYKPPPLAFPCERETLKRLLWRSDAGMDIDEVMQEGGGGVLRDWHGLNLMAAFDGASVVVEICKGSRLLRTLLGVRFDIADWCDLREG